ncbi:response regulator [Sphingomonas deserti]|uniref:Response regulator n=2 Tax=Allosphingosinicella deserti TaxID=2116704 RepID=A0A2P7QL01_9SPHN|nr:response regulator [Sphingomonas deserti]
MLSLAPDRGDRPRVLLVEDDAAVRRALQLLLQGQGYDVRAYRSAIGLARDPEALRAACLVCDLIMPEKDAVELLGELRAAGWAGPGILISGQLDDRFRGQAQGFERVLAKPIAENLLKRSVAELIGRRSPPAV